MALEETVGTVLGVYVDVSGTMTLVAARQDLELNETAETREVTNASTGGDWREFLAGAQEWTISLGHILLLDDETGAYEASHKAMRDAKRNRNQITVQLRYPGTDNAAETGNAIITELSLTAGYDEMGTVSATLQGAGPLTYQTGIT